MWCGDVDTPPGYSLALRGHVGGSGQGTGRCGAAQCYYRDNRIWRGISTPSQSTYGSTYDSQNKKQDTFTIYISLRSNKLNTTNSIFFLQQLWFATRKTALAPKARNMPTPRANAAQGTTTLTPLTLAPPFAPPAGILATVIRNAAQAANL